MAIRSVALVTGWSESLGSGHLQRSIAVLWYAIFHRGLHAIIVMPELPPSFPAHLKEYYRHRIDFRPDCIIRDMRDSTVEEISALADIAPVVAIDDNGEGRNRSAAAIDVLPNPEHPRQTGDDRFIYGYGFLQSMSVLAQGAQSVIRKEIDYALYPGIAPRADYTDFIISCLPSKASFAVLQGERSFVSRGKGRERIPAGEYARMLLSSRVMITHFGITLYEAILSGCSVALVNPGAYHSRLSDMVIDPPKIVNLGEESAIERTTLMKQLGAIRDAHAIDTVDARDAYARSLARLEKFFALLEVTVQRS